MLVRHPCITSVDLDFSTLPHLRATGVPNVFWCALKSMRWLERLALAWMDRVTFPPSGEDRDGDGGSRDSAPWPRLRGVALKHVERTGEILRMCGGQCLERACVVSENAAGFDISLLNASPNLMRLDVFRHVPPRRPRSPSGDASGSPGEEEHRGDRGVTTKKEFRYSSVIAKMIARMMSASVNTNDRELFQALERYAPRAIGKYYSEASLEGPEPCCQPACAALDREEEAGARVETGDALSARVQYIGDGYFDIVVTEVDECFGEDERGGPVLYSTRPRPRRFLRVPYAGTYLVDQKVPVVRMDYAVHELNRAEMLFVARTLQSVLQCATELRVSNPDVFSHTELVNELITAPKLKALHLTGPAPYRANTACGATNLIRLIDINKSLRTITGQIVLVCKSDLRLFRISLGTNFHLKEVPDFAWAGPRGEHCAGAALALQVNMLSYMVDRNNDASCGAGCADV